MEPATCLAAGNIPGLGGRRIFHSVPRIFGVSLNCQPAVPACLPRGPPTDDDLLAFHHFDCSKAFDDDSRLQELRLWPSFDWRFTDTAMSSNTAIISSFVEGAPPGEVSTSMPNPPRQLYSVANDCVGYM